MCIIGCKIAILNTLDFLNGPCVLSDYIISHHFSKMEKIEKFYKKIVIYNKEKEKENKKNYKKVLTLYTKSDTIKVLKAKDTSFKWEEVRK